MNQYTGSRTKAGPLVTVNGDCLNPRLDLRNHSPTGLEWGYSGSGPAQLALAILADHYKDDEKALEIYQRFKFAVIAKLPKHGWTLTEEHINQALRSLTEEDNGTCMDGCCTRYTTKAVFAKIRIGHIVATPNALRNVSPNDIINAIRRHQAGDWGELGAADWDTNECALMNGGRLLSRYRSARDVVFWLITEADRSATTVLLPEDY